MSTPPAAGNGRQLGLALLAFTATFYGWALLGPLGPELQEDLGLSDVQLSVAVAVPVLLGSLLRIPMGVLSERYGGRTTFTWLLAFSILPLVLLGFVHDSFAAIIVLGFLLGAAGVVLRHRRPVRQPLVSAGAPGRGPRPVRRGHGRHRARRPHGAADRRRGGNLRGLLRRRRDRRRGARACGSCSRATPRARARPSPCATRSPSSARAGGRGPSCSSTSSPSAASWRCTSTCRSCSRACTTCRRPTPARGPRASRCWPSSAGRWAASSSDRIGAERVLRVCFLAVLILAFGLAVGYESMAALTVCCLTMALALGFATGAVFKLVPVWFPDNVGAATGIVAAAGGSAASSRRSSWAW